MHRSFIFLLSLVGVCTATFFGGESTKSLPVFPSPPQLSHPHIVEHEHVHVQPSPKIIKVILKNDHSHEHVHEHSEPAQIIKVIHENSGRSNGHWHDDSHAHSSHGSHSSDSKFLSILPQILQIIYADEGRSHSYGHGGSSGSFFSTVSKGADFYKGGHVIEKGELKLRKIPNTKNYDDESSGGGFDKASLLSLLKPSAGPPGWSSSGTSGWSSSGSSGWSSGWKY